MTAETIKEVTGKFVEDAKKIYGSKLHGIILYGSCARGDFEADSDIDMLVLLDVPQNQINEERRRILDVSDQLDLEYGTVLSPVFQTNQTYRLYMPVSAFYQNVEREGVRIMSNPELCERFLFRDIRQEEAEEAARIEKICFPPNEACSREKMLERAAAASELFLVAVERASGRIAGFLNGLATNEETFRDEFFTDAGLYVPDGKNVMLLGLDVLPEYRGQGLAREIVSQYRNRERARGRKRLLLTCLESKVKMYEKMGFRDEGIANSSWGGEEWHEMSCELLPEEQPLEEVIYLAGGCFWGTQRYFDCLPGVICTEVGYANGRTENPSYEQVCRKDTGHAETVKVVYDARRISLKSLLEQYYKVIDPVSVNRQGGDVGTQYRTGIYYTEPAQREVITASLARLQERYDQPLAVENLPLSNFYTAEEYHQKYLEKNPGGYCHIAPEMFEEARRYRVE